MKQILYQIEQAQSFNQVKLIVKSHFSDIKKRKGSSRIVIPISKNRVLKVAYNQKGIAQNLVEAEAYSETPTELRRHLAKIYKADQVTGTWVIQHRVTNTKRVLNLRDAHLKVIDYLHDILDVAPGDLNQVGNIGNREVLFDYGLTMHTYKTLYLK